LPAGPRKIDTCGNPVIGGGSASAAARSLVIPDLEMNDLDGRG
jgi:hypothetical protein